MNINISRTSGEMAQRAAACAAQAISRTIAQNGEARILLSTGESQIEAIRYLTEMEVEWDKVSCSIWMNTLTLRKHIKPVFAST